MTGNRIDDDMSITNLQDCLAAVIDNRGVTPRKRGTAWQDDGVRVFSANNVKTSGLQKLDEIRCIPEEIYSSWMKIPLEKGDIILTSEAPAGEVYYWNSDEKIVLGQRLYGLKVKEEISSLYLKYYLQSDVGQKAIAAQQSGSTVFGIAAATFSNIMVRLPERSKQNDIANILYLLDSKIHNNKKLMGELEATAPLIYDYWFTQFDFPDENGKPYRSTGGKMLYNSTLKRDIPEGWQVISLGDIVELKRGVSYSSANLFDTGIPMINLASFSPGGEYKADGIKYFTGKFPKEKELKPYDLVICNTQQTALDPSKDIIGKSLLVPDIFDSAILSSHHVTTVKVSDASLKMFLFAFFRSAWFNSYITGFASGTSILGLDNNGLLGTPIVVPSKKVLDSFADWQLNIERTKNLLLKETIWLSDLRDWLLPMLMNGQVSVQGTRD